jgi:hypothetical protein
MIFAKKLLYITGIGIFLSSSILVASEVSAKSILKHAYHYISTLDQYAFDATVINDEIQEGKPFKQTRQEVSVKIDRPNNLRVDSKGAVKNRSNYLHQGLFTMIDHEFGYYGQIKLPHQSIDDALDYIFEHYGIKAPLAALIYSDMYKRSKFSKSTYFGQRTIDGINCDYIAFRNKGGEVHIWISRGEQPLVKSFTVIDTTVPGHPKTSALIRWNLHPTISEQDFIFKAPKGVFPVSVERAQ